MSTVIRDLDASEQRRTEGAAFQAVALGATTGTTLTCFAVPYPSTLAGILVSAHGASGAPTIDFGIERFIVGTGFTTLTAGFTTLTLTEFATSGMQTVVQVAAGNSLLNLAANDVFVAVGGGADSAVTSLGISVVFKATQDVKTSFSY